MIKLGVNIDHIATLRNARMINTPDPMRALNLIKDAGGDSVTIHLREDRRHINDLDVKKIKDANILPMNLEIASTDEMLEIAIKTKPWYVCIVPEKREELTTEGGLDLSKNKERIKFVVDTLRKNNIKVSLFIDPSLDSVNCAKKYINADAVEIHTGQYANATENNDIQRELGRIKEVAKFCVENNIIFNAGHGLNYENVQQIAKIDGLNELNIGHFLVGESIFVGLKDSITKMRKIINT